MTRFLFVTIGVLCLGLVAFSTAVAVPDARLSIDTVDVDPDTPTAGSPVTVSPTIESSVGSTEPVDIDSVALEDGNETLVNVTNSGALSPGDSVSVPLTTTFDDPGTYDLSINVSGTDSEGNTTTAQRPISLVVEPGSPQLELNTRDAVNETATTIEGLVTNPTESTLRDIELSLDGDGFEGLADRRTISSLGAGEEREFTLEVRPETNGTVPLEVNATYRTGIGTEDTVSLNESLLVSESRYNVSLEVTTAELTEQEDDELDDVGDIGIDIPGLGGDSGVDGDSSTPTSEVRITVSNVGNAPVTDVTLDSQIDGESFSVRPVTTELLPGAEQTVPIGMIEQSASNLSFEATYDAGGEPDTVATEIDRSRQQGALTVTGADLAIDGDQATITGDIGNTGGGAVSGVVVTVLEGDDVSPAYPARDFFLGEIEDDGFAPFELTATVGENATEVPLELRYTVGGEERTEAMSLPVDEQPDTEEDRFPSLVFIAGLATALFALVGLLVGLYLRKR